MPTLHRFTDKTKAFFGKLTGRPRSSNGNELHSTDQESERVPTTYTQIDDAPECLVAIQGNEASAVRLSSVSEAASGGEIDHTVEQDDVKLPSAPASISSPRFSPTTSTASTPKQTRDILSTSTALPFNVEQPNARHHSHLSPPTSGPRLQVPSSPSLWARSENSSYLPSSTSSYFSNSSGFSIGSVNNVQNFGIPRTVFEFLEPHISHGAAYDSCERSDAPKCAPETRCAVQEDIVSWMRDGDSGDDPKRILWLSGPAGSGKTAIAGSVAETCRAEGLLAATFFFSSFSGSEDRHSKRSVVATLAHHLAGHPSLHEYKEKVLLSIENRPDIFYKCLSEQAQHLLLEPFRAIQGQPSHTRWPKSIMIDGLDEVLAKKHFDWTAEDLERAHGEDQLEILNILLSLVNDPAFPFRVFIASRPERVITDFFSGVAQAETVTLFLDSKYKPDEDIERFLWSKFSGIRRRCRILKASWPGQEVVDRIVDMSSGQFIVPATVVRHIEAGVPQRQLDDIMQLKWEDSGRKNPFAVVDALYTCILRRSPEPALAAKWLRVYTSARNDDVPALFFRQLVEDFEGEFHHVLEPLSSLVFIPISGDDDAPLKVYHKSLSDYLSSQHRCGEFYLSPADVEGFAAGRCVDVLKQKGPVVPLDDVRPFLNRFYGLALVNLLGINDKGGWGIPARHWPVFTNVPRCYGDTLSSLAHPARDQLAQCDVAWWTRLCLADIPFESDGFGKAFLYGMYSGIHVYICESGSPSTSTTCHSACIHWRAGILAEANALNWCVHELEEARLEELSHTTSPWFDSRFKKMGRREGSSFSSCPVCRPTV